MNGFTCNCHTRVKWRILVSIRTTFLVRQSWGMSSEWLISLMVSRFTDYIHKLKQLIGQWTFWIFNNEVFFPIMKLQKFRKEGFFLLLLMMILKLHICINECLLSLRLDYDELRPVTFFFGQDKYQIFWLDPLVHPLIPGNFIYRY